MGYCPEQPSGLHQRLSQGETGQRGPDVIQSPPGAAGRDLIPLVYGQKHTELVKTLLEEAWCWGGASTGGWRQGAWSRSVLKVAIGRF